MEFRVLVIGDQIYSVTGWGATSTFRVFAGDARNDPSVFETGGFVAPETAAELFASVRLLDLIDEMRGDIIGDTGIISTASDALFAVEGAIRARLGVDLTQKVLEAGSSMLVGHVIGTAGKAARIPVLDATSASDPLKLIADKSGFLATFFDILEIGTSLATIQAEVAFYTSIASRLIQTGADSLHTFFVDSALLFDGSPPATDQIVEVYSQLRNGLTHLQTGQDILFQIPDTDGSGRLIDNDRWSLLEGVFTSVLESVGLSVIGAFIDKIGADFLVAGSTVVPRAAHVYQAVTNTWEIVENFYNSVDRLTTAQAFDLAFDQSFAEILQPTLPEYTSLFSRFQDDLLDASGVRHVAYVEGDAAFDNVAYDFGADTYLDAFEQSNFGFLGTSPIKIHETIGPSDNRDIFEFRLEAGQTVGIYIRGEEFDSTKSNGVFLYRDGLASPDRASPVEIAPTAREQIEDGYFLEFAELPEFTTDDRGLFYWIEVRDQSDPNGIDGPTDYQLEIVADAVPPIATEPSANDLPVFLSPSRYSVIENTAFVGVIRADDTHTVSYTISNGDDAGLFSIDSLGRLSFISPPDFETPNDANGNGVYNVVVTATDTFGASTDEAITVVVDDAQESQGDVALPILSAVGSRVGEGAPLSFNLSLDRAPSPDQPVTITYRLTGDTDEFSAPYSEAQGRLVLNTGEVSSRLVVPTIADTDNIGDTISLEILSVEGATYAGGRVDGFVDEAGGLADLAISTLSLDRTVLSEDGLMVLTLTVQNIGSDAAPGVISIANQQEGFSDAVLEIDVGTLSAGSTRNLTFRVVDTASHPAAGASDVIVLSNALGGGAVRLTASVDATQSVQENEESNNSRSVDFMYDDGVAELLPDLTVGAFNLTETSAAQGGDFDFSFTVVNQGAGNVASVDARIFISTDAHINPEEDVELSLQSLGSISAGAQKTIYGTVLGGRTLNLQDGPYFVSLIVDDRNSVAENDEANNAWGSPISFAIGNVPGVGGFGLQFSSTIFEGASPQIATVTITNDGATPALAGYATLFLSDDEIIAPGDIQLRRVVVPELEVGETVELTFDFFSRDEWASGTYYAGVRLDDIPGNPDFGTIGPVIINVNDTPESGRDLEWSSFNISDTLFSQGDGVRLDYGVVNSGDGRSEGGGLRFYASTDRILDTGDTLLGEVIIGPLDGGASIDRSMFVSTRALSEGDYYIFAEIVVPAFPVVDDDLSNNTTGPVNIRVVPPAEAEDGQVLPGWENGQPDRFAPRYDMYDYHGNLWDIDYDASIHTGNGGFYREAYDWIGFFEIDSAVLELEGDGIIFTGMIDGVDAERRIYVNDSSSVGLAIRFLDTVTNTTDQTQVFTFQYQTDIISPFNQPQIVTESSGDGIITNADTAFTFTQDDPSGSSISPPLMAWGIGERDFFTADSVMVPNTGSRIYVSHTVTLDPGESASFLHFAGQSNRTDDDFSHLDLPRDLASAFTHANGRLYGLTPQDLLHVINWDVSTLITPGDNSIAATLTDLGSAEFQVTGTLTNEGALISDSGAIVLSLLDVSSGEVTWQTEIAGVLGIEADTPISFSYTDRLFQKVSSGNFEVIVSFLGDGIVNDNAGNNETSLGILNLSAPVLFTSGNDTVRLYQGTVFDAGDGDDTIDGTDGADRIIAGNGRDIIRAAGGDDIISDEGFDTLDNLFYGEAGNDTLTGGDGMDTLDGGVGDDILIGGGGRDNLSGGAGVDTASFRTSAAGVAIDLKVGIGFSGDAAGDMFDSIENLVGSALNDTLLGGDSSNILIGSAGDDQLHGEGGSDLLQGDTGDDGLLGGRGDDQLYGGSGSDDLRGGEGNDLLDGGDGNDVSRGGAGNDTVLAGDGDDLLMGGSGQDSFDGGLGRDTLSFEFDGLAGATTGVTVELFAGLATDGFGNQETLYSIENVIGSGLSDTISGYSAYNRLSGLAGDDSIFGYGGEDILAGGAGNDLLDGGNSADTADYSGDIAAGGTQGIGVQLSAGTAIDGFGDTDTLVSIENIIGTQLGDVIEGSDTANELSGGDGDDALFGYDRPDSLYGGAGADFIAGGTGDDLAEGGAGNDRIFGESGNDALYGDDGDDYVVGNEGNDLVAGGTGNDNLQGRDGNDRIYGEDGNDRLYGGAGDDLLIGNGGDDRLYGEAGNDDLQGRSGFDTADYSTLSSGIEVNLAAGTVDKDAAGTDTVSGIEAVIGTAATDIFIGTDGADTFYGGDAFDFFNAGGGDDILYGEGGNDRIFALDGDDIVYGGDGDDYLVGNAGDDTMYGEAGDDNLQGREGNDTMFGGTGNDQFYGLGGDDFADGGDGDDFIAGYEGNDTLIGGAGNDRFFGMDDDDTLHGGDGDDFLIANAGNDTVYGDAGNDNLRGRAGDDVLSGGDGNDYILADDGNDRISGDGGFDTMFGGSGADTFAFSGNWRRDTVADWTDGEDTIDLSALGLKGAGESDVDAFARLTLTQDGTTAIISVTGDTRNDIRLANTDIATIDAGDFTFAPAGGPAAGVGAAVVSITRADSFDFSGVEAGADTGDLTADNWLIERPDTAFAQLLEAHGATQTIFTPMEQSPHSIDAYFNSDLWTDFI